jgi:hypothetical protein
MKATGLFFLRMYASTFNDASGARVGVSLPVIERDPADHRKVLNTLTVHWSGPDAIAFFDRHSAELRAGRGVQLELDRLRGHDGEWVALATHCELAPVAPSWQKHEAASAQPATAPVAAA